VRYVCKVRGTADDGFCNDKIKNTIDAVWSAYERVKSSGDEVTVEKIKDEYGAPKVPKSKSFIDYAIEKLRKTSGIAEKTRVARSGAINKLREFGGIVSFGDITTTNVLAFVNWLKGRGYKQQTVHTAYKTLRRYINVARVRGLVKSDPLLGVRVSRGQSEQGRWLSEDELCRMEMTKILPPLDKVRDLFLVQCYTGLAYSDLTAMCVENVQEEDGMPVLTGCRQKTGQPFAIPLLPGCVEILDRYGWRLPLMSLEQYNMRLKAVADICGIDKPVASHWGRRTCGTMLLNKGVPIEVVAKILGHSNIKITQQCYAKILNKTVVAAMRRVAAK